MALNASACGFQVSGRESEEHCRELLRINKRPPKHKMNLAAILTELGTDQNLKFYREKHHKSDQ